LSDAPKPPLNFNRAPPDKRFSSQASNSRAQSKEDIRADFIPIVIGKPPRPDRLSEKAAEKGKELQQKPHLFKKFSYLAVEKQKQKEAQEELRKINLQKDMLMPIEEHTEYSGSRQNSMCNTKTNEPFLVTKPTLGQNRNAVNTFDDYVMRGPDPTMTMMNRYKMLESELNMPPILANQSQYKNKFRAGSRDYVPADSFYFDTFCNNTQTRIPSTNALRARHNNYSDIFNLSAGEQLRLRPLVALSQQNAFNEQARMHLDTHSNFKVT
jgi:hypothetical protein